MEEVGPVATTPTARSGRRSVWRAARLVLRRAAPSVLVVLVAASLLLGGLVSWGTWSGTQLTGLLLLGGTTGVANVVWVLLGLAGLLGWARAVRTVVPVLVAGGVTRREVTGSFLVAAVALGVAVTAMLGVVGVAGGALQRGLTTLWQAPPVTVGSAGYVSSMRIVMGEGPTVYFDPAHTLPWFVLAALAGVLLGAVWYRWRARGALGVAVSMPVVLIAYWLLAPIVSSGAVDTFGGSLPDAVGPPYLVLVVTVWLVLRRVPLRPPAR